MAAERSVNVRVRLKGASEFKKDMQGVNGSLAAMGGWLETTKGILASDLIRSGLNAIADAMRACWDASVEFESAMAGVQKTTGMSDVQLEAMGNELMNLSERIPVTAKELAGLAETSGQLGIAEDDITEFVEVVAAMGVSTNMSAEEAATAMARMANIMGTGAQDYERLGSTVVELGNNMATTESEIIDMGQSMAGVGNLVGMSEADVLAFAAAMSSVGIEAEAGASSMSTLWTNIETMVATGSAKLNNFAQIAGVSTQEFMSMWDDDAAGAFSLFISGLREMGLEGESVMSILKELGITESRQRRAVASLAGANDVLAESLEMGGEAWDENTALAEEAATFYGTTASQIQMAEDALENLKTAAGDSFKPIVTDFMTGLGNTASEIRKSMTEMEPLADLVAGNAAEYEAQAKSIDKADRQAKALIADLEAMGDFGLLSGADQQRYLADLRLLQEIVPSTKNIIDAETGAIEGGTEALYENAEAARANAEQAAKLQEAQENYDAYVLAQDQLADTQAALTAAQAEANRAQEEYTAIVERRNELMAEAEAEAARRSAETGMQWSEQDMLLEVGVSQNGLSEYEILGEKLEETSDYMASTTGLVDELNRSIDEQTAELEASAGIVEDYNAQMTAMGETYESVIEGTQGLTDAERDAANELTLMQGQMEALLNERATAMEEAEERVDSIISGFGAMEMPEAVSADELLENLQSQIDYMEAYQENLAAVQEMGLDADIVTMLSDGSTESAAILAGLAEDGGESIDALNAKFAEVGTAKDTMATAMAEASIDFQGRATEIVTACNNMVAEVNQYSEAYANGASTIQGIIDGINSRIGLLQNRVGRVQSLAAQAASAGSGGTSHAAGLTYVPYDGYLAQLHRGEMVLTALEARAYRAQQFADYGALAALEARGGIVNNDYRRAYDGRIDNSVRVGDIYVRNETDISRLERQLTGRSRSVARGYGAMGR